MFLDKYITYFPNGSVQVTSIDGHATLTLSPNGQLFKIIFPAEVYENKSTPNRYHHLNI